jgi:hypothetical protein
MTHKMHATHAMDVEIAFGIRFHGIAPARDSVSRAGREKELLLH